MKLTEQDLEFLISEYLHEDLEIINESHLENMFMAQLLLKYKKELETLKDKYTLQKMKAAMKKSASPEAAKKLKYRWLKKMERMDYIRRRMDVIQKNLNKVVKRKVALAAGITALATGVAGYSAYQDYKNAKKRKKK